MEDLTALLEECSAAFKETEEYRILSTYTSRDSRFTFDERLAITKSVEQTFKPCGKGDSPLFHIVRRNLGSKSLQGWQ